MKSTSNQRTTDALVGCTIADRTVKPQAMVLGASFLRFHPEARFTILLVDGPGDPGAVSPASVLGISDLGLGAGEEWRLPMLYEGHDLASAVKPALLQALLTGGARTVVYFEYSTLMFQPLTKAELPDGERAIVATEAIKNDHGDAGRSFIAVRPGAEAALKSWFSSGRNDSSLLEAGLDAVPHSVITSPGFGVAYWNLNPVGLTSSADGYQLNGQPLRSFDFRGYDPDKPHLLSKYQGLEPRILLSEHPAIAKLCDEYREQVVRGDPDTDPARKSRLGSVPSGLVIDRRMLRLYREALDKWRSGQAAEPPSPFGPGGEEGFLNWLNEPMNQSEKQVTRYMLAVREDRQDVRDAFTDPLGADAAGFRDWYLLFGRHELKVPKTLVPCDSGPNDTADRANALTAFASVPVNVAGYFRAELGLGVAARSLLSALEAAGIPFNTISFDATANRQNYPFVDHAAGATADINIVCVNPDQLAAFAEQTGPELRNGRYTIGVWFWEAEDFPPSFHGAFNYVDEIWVASDFMRETFLKVSPKPVFKFVLPVLTPQVDPALSRVDLNLPDGFIFLFSFDFLSVLERKNPLGLIKAFTGAFSDGEGPTLAIKTINGDKRCLEIEKLRYAVRGRSDIILMDRYLSQIENNTLTALSDCYTSLHRSEGFGLTIAEAMALAKPCIATNYSGNLEFMTSANSYLCPAQRREVGPEHEPYPEASYWAEPDLDAAADLLRHVYHHQEEARDRAAQAAADMRSLHAPTAASGIIGDRLGRIRRRRARTGLAPSTALLEDRIEELETENARLRAKS
jgi:glycosyltransferase involved in cell wall biosynthesis